jgi:hypothetical protein
MRFLGFLFVVVLVVAVIGLFRGWFSLTTTTYAKDKTDVTFGVHTDKLKDDADRIAALPEKVAEQVRGLGRKVNAEESEIDGTVSVAELPSRRLVVTSGTQTLEFVVESSVRIERRGEAVSFDQLRPTERVRLTFRHDGEARRLVRIDLLAER